MKRFLAILIVFMTGCAVPQRPAAPHPAAQPTPIAHHPRAVLIFVPQTDESAASWLKWFERYPNLRLTIAMSPRFTRLSKDPVLKAKVLSLEKAGRLELAMQLPNAPFLPLIIDTNSAKNAVPAGTLLPAPPFAYPDDVIQIIARAKADFFRQWNGLPRGLVLPHGAVSSRLLAMFDRLGYAWLAGALGAPAGDGPYQSGNVMLWDGTPAGTVDGTAVRVWDERDMKENGKPIAPPIVEWAQELQKDDLEPVLPSAMGIQSRPLPPETQWTRRAWVSADWTPWIGSLPKNAAWNWLRRTREALESYKNSGQASVQRLDMAFEEFYAAESASYIWAIGNPALPANVTQEREQEFKATLGSVYRLMNQPPPDDLFTAPAGTAGAGAAVQASSTSIQAEALSGGGEHVVMTDAAGDDRGNGHLAYPAGGSPGQFDLLAVDVRASSQTVDWTVTLSSPSDAMVDIYVDLNHQPNIGTPELLPGRMLSTAEADAWEYALCLAGDQALLYRTSSGGGHQLSGTFPAERNGNAIRASIPRGSMAGSPRRWGYQVLVMALDRRSPQGTVPQPLSTVPSGSRLPPIFDLLDPLETNQTSLLNDVESGKRTDLPFVRVRTSR